MKNFQYTQLVRKDQIKNALELARFKSITVAMFFVVMTPILTSVYFKAIEARKELPIPEVDQLIAYTLISAIISGIIALVSTLLIFFVFKTETKEVETLESKAKSIEVIEIATLANHSKYYKAHTLLFTILFIIMVVFLGITLSR